MTKESILAGQTTTNHGIVVNPETKDWCKVWHKTPHPDQLAPVGAFTKVDAIIWTFNSEGYITILNANQLTDMGELLHILNGTET